MPLLPRTFPRRLMKSGLCVGGVGRMLALGRSAVESAFTRAKGKIASGATARAT